jgi:hypothetical protein
VKVTRRDFFEGLASGTVLLTLQACGGGGGGSGSGPGFGAGCNATTISGHSGHALNVPTADLTLTASKNYSIKGTADYDHTVTLTAQDLADLKKGLSVPVMSSPTALAPAAAHTHTVTINC